FRLPSISNIFLFSGAACKEKWKNLRSARHIRQKPPSGSSAQAKKKYYLADHLDFLLPFTKSRQQKGSIPSPKNKNEETYISTQEESTEIEPPEVHDENDLNKDAFEESSTNEPLLVTESALIRNKSSTKNRKEEGPLEKCAIDYFTSKSRAQLEKTEDADLLFLKSLLPDLQRMTNAQKHEFKYKTMQVIGEILYKPPTNNFTPFLTHSQHCPKVLKMSLVTFYKMIEI
ncbi:uncharacterized protein, partial [Leptinotarsa decemlineata]|uniref:uncharacterized protein n=1 Tax=Leptinotarsa decemlineata TaxID=7539 RepID=UPI003D30A88A